MTLVNPILSLGATGPILKREITHCKNGSGSDLYLAVNSEEKKECYLNFQKLISEKLWHMYLVILKTRYYMKITNALKNTCTCILSNDDNMSNKFSVLWAIRYLLH